MVTTFIGPIGAETPLIGSIKQQQVKEEGMAYSFVTLPLGGLLCGPISN